jgi:RLL motif containing protein 1
MDATRRQLKCVGYPFANDVNFSSKEDLIILVSWLEDRKIREMEIEQREVLRKDGEKWDSAFNEYLTSLGCPFEWVSASKDIAHDCISWLISAAVSAEFEDASEDCVDMEDLGDDSTATVFTNMNTSMEVEANNTTTSETESALAPAINKLGEMLLLTRNNDENDIIYLQRISKKIKFFLTDGSLKCLLTNNANGIKLKSFPSAFESTDIVLKQVSIIIRMLYLSDFRELQNDLNSLIVLGQEYTANPKTNNSLGVVGR